MEGWTKEDWKEIKSPLLISVGYPAYSQKHLMKGTDM